MINAPTSNSVRRNVKKPALSRSWDTGRTAFKLISEHRTSADPTSYAVWFEYVAKKNQQLVAAVDEILAHGLGISSVDLQQIHERFLRNSRHAEEQLEDISNAIQTKVAGAKSLVNDAITNTSDYVASMDKAKSKLPRKSSPDEILRALDGIIEDTQSSKESAQNIRVALQSTQEEISHLNGKVGQIREKLMRDPLTDLLNRQKFETVLEEHAADALANGYSLTLLAVSIKNTQDLSLKAGMDISEFMLKSLSGILVKAVADKGVCARLGGVELAILLPKSSYADASKMAREIMEELELFKIVKKPSEELVGHIECAFGGSSLKAGLSAPELISVACDQAEQAKFSHKNTVKFDLTNHHAA